MVLKEVYNGGPLVIWALVSTTDVILCQATGDEGKRFLEAILADNARLKELEPLWLELRGTAEKLRDKVNEQTGIIDSKNHILADFDARYTTLRDECTQLHNKISVLTNQLSNALNEAFRNAKDKVDLNAMIERLKQALVNVENSLFNETKIKIVLEIKFNELKAQITSLQTTCNTVQDRLNRLNAKKWRFPWSKVI